MNAGLNILASNSRRWATAAGAMSLAILIGLIAMAVSGAWTAGFSGADEPAHFLNSWFVALYGRDALGADPMAFATEFYLHYPKISIGHWPPAFYALLSPFFILFPATAQTAFALNLVIAALPAFLAALIVARLHGWMAALAAALVCAITPVALEAQSFFMLDQAVAAAALAATLLWISHVDRPRPWKVLGFALLSATAVLIKGNGWLLLFVPAFHLLITGRWSLLRSIWPWAAALLAALIVGPWYWLTAGIAADGFNHTPGLGYAWQALLFNLAALVRNLGPLALPLSAWALVSGWRARRVEPRRWTLIAGCTSLALATLALQSLVPVDLDDRYVAPGIPPLVVLMLAGAGAIFAEPGRARAAMLAAAAIAAVPGVIHLVQREPKIDLRLEEAARHASSRPSAWLIDGSTGAEGAFITAMAVRDPALHSYAIRASRLLADSDFMGSEYRLTHSRPGEVAARLKQLGVDGVVIVRIGGKPAFPHSAVLREALARPGSSYLRTASLPHRNRPGVTEIYRAKEPVAMNVPAIRALGLPAKANAAFR